MSTLGTEDPVHHMAKYRKCNGSFEFALDMERAGKILGIDSVRVLARYTALQLDRLIVLKTPKDTGRAQCSWNMAEGKIDRSVHPEVPEGQKVSPKPKTGAGISGNTIIYISNSLPYIIPLEYGHSGQSPEGMVSKSIEDLRHDPTLGVMR